MAPNIQSLLTEAASLSHEVEGFLDLPKLASFVRGIAQHLLSELPAPIEADIHATAVAVAGFAPAIEAVTPSPSVQAIEVGVAAVASEIATDTVAPVAVPANQSVDGAASA